MKRYEWLCLAAIMAVCLLFSCSACTNTLSPDERAQIEKFTAFITREQTMIAEYEKRIPSDASTVSSFLPISVINNYTNFSLDALSKEKRIINDCQEILSNIPDNIDKEELRQKLLTVAIGLYLATDIRKLIIETELSMLNRGLERMEVVKKAAERLKEILNNSPKGSLE